MSWKATIQRSSRRCGIFFGVLTDLLFLISEWHLTHSFLLFRHGVFNKVLRCWTVSNGLYGSSRHQHLLDWLSPWVASYTTGHWKSSSIALTILNRSREITKNIASFSLFIFLSSLIHKLKSSLVVLHSPPNLIYFVFPSLAILLNVSGLYFQL